MTLWQLLQRTLAKRRIQLTSSPDAAKPHSSTLVLDWSSLPHFQSAIPGKFPQRQSNYSSNFDASPTYGQDLFPRSNENFDGNVNQASKDSPHPLYLAAGDPSDPNLTPRQYSEELRRNRQILRAILALELQEDMTHNSYDSNKDENYTIEHQQYHRQREMLIGSSQSAVNNNESLSSVGRYSGSFKIDEDVNHSNSEYGGGGKSYDENPTTSDHSPQSRDAGLLQPSSSRQGHYNSQSSQRHHQHNIRSNSRADTRSWSAHVIFTTETATLQQRLKV